MISLDRLLNDILLDNQFLTEADLQKMFESLIMQAANTIGRNVDDTLDMVVKSDPTKRKYVEWILKLITNRMVNFPEDAQRIVAALRAFEVIKKRTNLEFERDIRKHDLGSLEDIVERFGKKKSQRQLKKKFKEEGTRLVAQTPEYTIIEILGGQYAPKYAKGTRWCTSSPTTAATYIKRGGLFLIMKSNGDTLTPFIQFTGDFQQIMDIKDQRVKWENIPPNLKRLLTPSKNTDPRIMSGFATFSDTRLSPDLEQLIANEPSALSTYKWRHKIPDFMEIMLQSDPRSVQAEFLTVRWQNGHNTEPNLEPVLNNLDRPAAAGALIMWLTAHSFRPSFDPFSIGGGNSTNPQELLKKALEHPRFIEQLSEYMHPRLFEIGIGPQGLPDDNSANLKMLQQMLINLYSEPENFAMIAQFHNLISYDGKLEFPEPIIQRYVEHDYAWMNSLVGIFRRLIKYPESIKPPELKKVITSPSSDMNGPIILDFASQIKKNPSASKKLFDQVVKWGSQKHIILWSYLFGIDMDFTINPEMALEASLLRGIPTKHEVESVLSNLEALHNTKGLKLMRWVSEYKKSWNGMDLPDVADIFNNKDTRGTRGIDIIYRFNTT